MVRIVIIGNLYFINKLANSLQKRNYDVTKISNLRDWNKRPYYYLRKIKNVDIVYFFNGIGLKKIFLSLIIKFIYKKKIIVHFVGSDALKFINSNLLEKFRWKTALKFTNKVFGIS